MMSRKLLTLSVPVACLLSPTVALGYGVVLPDDPKPWERTAAVELTNYLARVVGDGAVRIVGRGEVLFHVGDTALAGERGLVSARMDEEQWRIVSCDTNIVLNGGGSRGCLYAVSHFLEDFCDVRWWGNDDEDVPARESLDLPFLEVGGKPHFGYRQIYTGNDRYSMGQRMVLHHRLNAISGKPLPAELGGSVQYGPPASCHTWDRYLPFSKYGKEHPEWYSLLDGERIGGKTRGQFCLTCPGLIECLSEEVEKAVSAAEVDARAKGRTPPWLYDLSMNDNSNACQCENCMRETELYGHSGAQLRFVNAVTEKVVKLHPYVRFTTFAYMYSEPLPTGGVRAADHVIVRLCNTRQNIAGGMGEESQKAIRDLTTGWGDFAKGLFIWEYAITYNKTALGLPVPSEFHLGDKYAFYARQGVQGLFIENEHPEAGDMYEMKYYLMSHLLENPMQDADRLAVDFLRRYYGKEPGRLICRAREHLDRIRRERGGFLPMYAAPSDFNFIRDEDFAKVDALWDEAEARAEGDARRLKRIRFSRQSMERLKRLRARYVLTRKNGEVGLTERPFYDFPATNSIFKIRSSHGSRWVDDPEASTGRAIGMPFTNKLYRFPLSIFLFDRKKKISVKNFAEPLGTGYQWYDLGSVKMPNVFSMCFTSTSDVSLAPAIPEAEGNTYVIKARLKATDDELFIDRVVLLEP